MDMERVVAEASPTPSLCIGNSVHRALENFYRLPDPVQRTEETLVRVFASKWTKARIGAFSSEAEEAQAKNDAERMLSGYARSFDLLAAPLRLEQPFQLRLGSGIVINTRIDRIDAGRHGGVRIIDYKTSRGSEQLEDRDLWQETATWVHILAVEAAAHVEVERYSWIYLDTSTEICIEPERDDVEECRQRLRDALQGIYKERDFEPRPGEHCRYCSVRMHCEAGRQ